MRGVQFVKMILIQGRNIEGTGDEFECEQLDTFPWVLVWKKGGAKAAGRVTTVFNIASRSVEESDLAVDRAGMQAKPMGDVGRPKR
jgi:hypothetical protein